VVGAGSDSCGAGGAAGRSEISNLKFQISNLTSQISHLKSETAAGVAGGSEIRYLRSEI